MICVNCKAPWSGDMASIMAKKLFNHTLQGELLMRGVIKAQELMRGWQCVDAQGLLVDLYPQACQLCGSKHAVTKIIKSYLELVDLHLEKLKESKESKMMLERMVERLEEEHDRLRAKLLFLME